MKIVFITGATSGIGKVTAEFLSDKGFKVYGTGRNPKEISEKFTLLKMDVRDENSVQSIVNQIVEKEGRIDILINNAGVGISGAVEEIPSQELENVFQTNFFGAIRVMKSVLPTMRKNHNGLIINITSIAGYMGLPFRGAYSASKSALEIITEAIRMETAQFGIKICNLAPGDVATDIAQRRYHAPVQENSPYGEIYKKSLKLMNSDVNSGQNPLRISEKIFKIILQKQPKVKYVQGSFLQRFSIVLKKILPSRWYEHLLMKHYRLK